MTINALDDMTQLKLAAGAFFEKLNQTVLPERFNWSSEIYEGLHVAERRGQDFYGQTESTKHDRQSALEKNKQDQTAAAHEYLYHQFPELSPRVR